jgi:formylglycine-generating enzyme required for sulfatase activity
MLGNVQEWCRDWYAKDYQQHDKQNTSARVVRGGSWQSNAAGCRAARRQANDLNRRNIVTGFRVVVRLREQ